MSLDQPDVVDAIGIDRDSTAAILTILDSWDWSDARGHLFALQKKINSYLAFIETGEVFESYPNASGRKLIIEIVGKYQVPEPTQSFFTQASSCAAELQVELRLKHLPS